MINYSEGGGTVTIGLLPGQKSVSREPPDGHKPTTEYKMGQRNANKNKVVRATQEHEGMLGL